MMDGVAFAWLALDSADNDPARFWAHVVAALRQAGVEMPEAVGGALAAPGARASEAALPQLVNALAAAGAPVVLAIDDYHLVQVQEVHDGVAFLLAHLPATTRLVIASRTVPPLGIARLRANGELAEVAADALRFRDDEAAALLNGTLALELPASDLESLQSRTEGWAAGLYLAGLTLRDADDRRAAVAAFSGSDRHLVDYLAEEALAGLDEETRAFLLETSILDALTAALCDAVRRADGSRALLEQVEPGTSPHPRRPSTRLVPLPPPVPSRAAAPAGGRRATASGARSARAGRRMARRERRHDAAVHHALRAGLAPRRRARGARLERLLQRGRIGTVHTWLDALPPTRRARPELPGRAWIGFDSGELPGVERWLAAAEAADDGRVPGGRLQHPGAAAMLGDARVLVGDLGAAPAGGAGAAAGARRSSPWRAVALATLGTATYWTGGSSERAASSLEQAVGLERPGTNSLATLRSLGMLAVIAAGRGDSDAAAGWVARADELVAREALGEYHMGACATAVAGQLAAAAGDHAAGEALLERAAVLARRGAARADLAYALCARISVIAAARGAEAARDVLREARRTVAACPDPGVLARDLDAAERRLRGRAGAGDGRRGEDLLGPRDGRAALPPHAADVRRDRRPAVRLEEHRAHSRAEHLPQARRREPRGRRRRGPPGAAAVDRARRRTVQSAYHCRARSPIEQEDRRCRSASW